MTLAQTGKTALRSVGARRLVEVVRAKVAYLEPEKRLTEVRIFDTREGIASAMVVSSRLYDYVHLARIDGEWRILNVQWTLNPGAPRPGSG